MDPLTSALVTLLLLAGNAFFVASEFALVAAKRPRLERAAARAVRRLGRPSPGSTSCR